jgi:hypothetical protein
MDVIINVIINKNNMKTIFKTLALGLLLMTVASCEKHDPFDENTITGAVGPEAKWDIASSMIKAGESMEFTGQYYSTVADNYIDHSEVWYELFEKEDKLVSAALIKAFSYSYTSNTTAQKRMLQTIQSYPHSEDLWNDTLHAYVLADKFPISYTLSPVSWAQPKDTNGFTKNLHAYFGENFATEFKQGLTAKMNPSAEERNYGAYMNVINGLSLLTDTILTPNGDRMRYVDWMIDSTFNANTNEWQRFFKQIDTIWSKENFDTLGFRIDTSFTLKGRPPKRDTVWKYDTVHIVKPWLVSTTEVYPQIKQALDSVWENHVSFYDLILGADGYSIEYKREYYINAELRIYDKKGFDPAKHQDGAYTGGTYSKTDAKEIAIN